MIFPIDELYKQKSSNIAILLGTGASINRIDETQWSRILAHDTLALNNFIYFSGGVIPKWNSLEIQNVDCAIMKEHIEKKWKLGWGKVGWIVRKLEHNLALKAIGHAKYSSVYEFEWISRGHGANRGSQLVDANFRVKGPIITNSYKSRTTAMFHLLYKMKYDIIITYGIDLGNSRYLWSELNPDKYGPFHTTYNDNHAPDAPHGTAHTKDYIVDFNVRHMIPNGREIFVGHTDTILYPELRLWEGW